MSGNYTGDRMKIARTFTIDHHLYVRLKQTSNQSETVCKALRNYLEESSNLLLHDASTLRLVKELSIRTDIDNTLKNICELILTNGL